VDKSAVSAALSLKMSRMPRLAMFYVRQVRVDDEARTVVWPNGLDPAPELLYGDCEPAMSEGKHSQTPAVSRAA